MITNWLSWYWFNLMSCFERTQAHADNDVIPLAESLTNPDTAKKSPTLHEDKKTKKPPTNHEGEKVLAFGNYKGKMWGIKRMNNYVIWLLILCVIGFGLWLAIGAPSSYVESRGVNCEGGFLSCLSTYIDRYANIPLLFLMGLIIIYLSVAAWRESMRSDGMAVKKKEYDDHQEKLILLGDDDRGAPWYWLCVLGVGLLIEAAAIAIIASSYISDLTRGTENIIGAIVGGVVAVGLGYVVHHAGADLYSYRQRKKLTNRKEEERTLILDTIEDEKYHPWMLLISIVLIVGISSLAYNQRLNLNLNIIAEQAQTSTESDLFDDDLPDEITDSQKDAQQQFADNAQKREEKGLIAALLMLAVIFFIINFLGGMIGFHYGFLESKSNSINKKVVRYKRYNEGEQVKRDEAEESLRGKADEYFAKYFKSLSDAAVKLKKRPLPGREQKSEDVSKYLEKRGALTYPLVNKSENA